MVGHYYASMHGVLSSESNYSGLVLISIDGYKHFVTTKQFVSGFQFKGDYTIVSDYESIEEHLSKIEQKKYLHFDFPLLKSEQERFIDNIDTEIVQHRYLPFIRTNIVFSKYSNINKKVKPKIRKLTLPSHHDALVYQYFGYQLSKKYEEQISGTCVDNVAVAYRLNKHISNITVAKEIIDFVTDYNECWIIKGDFKSFFDTLDYTVLSKALSDLLGQNYDKSYKKMIHSLTNYRCITRQTLERQLRDLGIDKPYKRTSGQAYVKNLKQLGNLIRNRSIRLSSPNKIGIPQGTAVSAVLANIYMYDFDKWLATIAEKYNGIYRRYSDDFIVAIPLSISQVNDITILRNKIIDYSKNKVHLKIEHHKTQLLFYSKKNKMVLKLNGNSYKRCPLVYLGFSFDGTSVSLKAQSIYKFIYRSKRSINRYISFFDARKRYLASKGPSRCVLRYTNKDKKEFRSANKTENFQKRRLYIKAGTMKSEKVFTYHKNIVKKFMAINNIEPRSSMLSYANKAQLLFQNRTHGKYKVVIRRQMQRQIIKNQRKIGMKRKTKVRQN